MKTSSNFTALLAGLLAVGLFTAGCESNSPQPQPQPGAPTLTYTAGAPMTKSMQMAMTPQQAFAELKEGNERFVSKRPKVRNPLGDVETTATGQYPFAVVLSCLDSRKPIELVLDQGIGDIFSARIAGNVVNDDILGSMEFACKVSGSKLIAVIGHSNCGAVKGAIDDVHLGNLTELLAKIKPAADQVPADVEPRNTKNLVYVDKVAEANVRLAMKEIRERSPILRDMIDHGQIGLVGGMYDLTTGKIRFFDK
jgi:carbonic anhydrase